MLIFHSRNCRYLTRSCAIAFPVIMLICLIVPHLVQAAAGDLDSTFGVGGQVTTDLKRSTDLANAVAIQADGKLVVVGRNLPKQRLQRRRFRRRALQSGRDARPHLRLSRQSENRSPRSGRRALIRSHSTGRQNRGGGRSGAPAMAETTRVRKRCAGRLCVGSFRPAVV